MGEDIEEHDIVVLLTDISDEKLRTGDVGTVVFIHNNGEAFEVEFPNPGGEPRYIVATVLREAVLKLRNMERFARAAG